MQENLPSIFLEKVWLEKKFDGEMLLWTLAKTPLQIFCKILL